MKNKLFFGDNLSVMRSLPDSSIDLIYIDPPFFSGKNYSQQLLHHCYSDLWLDGIFSYLNWLNVRLYEMRRLLHPRGTIYVHCDWHASHYIKVEMDKLFGANNFLNEIIVHYYSGVGIKALAKKFHQNTETIFSYTKSRQDHIWNHVKIPLSVPRKTAKRFFDSKKKKTEFKRDANGKIEYYMTIDKKADNYIKVCAVKQNLISGLKYPTQKPEAILEQIVLASSNEGNLVADFFLGSGTTAVVAQRLNRKWIGCDKSKIAIQTTMKKLNGTKFDLVGKE